MSKSKSASELVTINGSTIVRRATIVRDHDCELGYDHKRVHDSEKCYDRRKSYDSGNPRAQEKRCGHMKKEPQL